MTSYLGWLDQSEEHQLKMRQVVDLFSERDARDELGIGVIRDAFSDLLFPALSTVQTRGRYFFFVPWLHRKLEDSRTPSKEAPQRARDLQWELVKALKEGGEYEGVIGIEAGRNVQRLPTSVYWNGLAALGIRRYRGQIGDYYRSLDHFRVRRRIRGERREEEGDDRPDANWSLDLPSPPDDYLTAVDFTLSGPEATYLADRIAMADPDSALAAAARGAIVDLDAPTPWAAFDTLTSPTLAERMRVAEWFSVVINGAALLYNLMLAEAADRETDGYRDRLDAWSDSVNAVPPVARIELWDLVRWSRVPGTTMAFVDRWLDLALPDAARVADSEPARRLIRDRELKLKGATARLRNRRALELWNGEAGTTPLTYRWATARRLIDDLRSAETHALA